MNGQQELIDRTNADNIKRFKAWLKKQFKDDWKYPDVFIQDMDIIIAAARELTKERRCNK
jgi:hypothetical protein